MSTEHAESRTLAGLISDLADETTGLVRKEVELARTEIVEKIGEATHGLSSVAAGGAVCFAGLLFVLLAVDHALEQAVPPWGAAAIVGIIVMLAGCSMIYFGRRRLSIDNLEPKQTLETLGDDKRWVQAHVGGGSRPLHRQTAQSSMP